MTARHPIEAAEGIFRTLGGFPPGDAGIPPPARLFAAVQAFAPVEFAVAEDLPDQDGFLFQYAAVTTFGEVGFVLGFARQFEVVDDEREHEGYVQLLAEYHFGHDAELAAEGHREDWWFPGWREPFEVWFGRVTTHPVWRFVETKKPATFEIWQEWV